MPGFLVPGKDYACLYGPEEIDVAEPFQMLIDTARHTPDPRAVTTWLTAYLGTRPLKAKIEALARLQAEVKAAAPEARVQGLVLRVIEKTRESLR